MPKLKRARKSTRRSPAVRVLEPNAAGIDIGATEIYVAVPSDRDPESVRRFSTFTDDLNRLADWLHTCGVRSVAMESTSVFWVPLFQILEDRGFRVCLVNARHVKNVPGRKTDVSDCQWLQYLHSVGLLRASHRPPQAICAVRSICRHRESLVQMAAVHIQHMQKALDQMNLQLHHVISDITGTTGLAIINAILDGERNPEKLAALRNGRIAASRETIARALVGDYRADHLFTLRQSLLAYRQYQQWTAACDAEIERQLQTLPGNLTNDQKPLSKAKDRHKPRRNELRFDLRSHLYRIFGVDLTQVPGISGLTSYTLLTEVGSDLSRFPNAAAFASWLGLCPEPNQRWQGLIGGYTQSEEPVGPRPAHVSTVASSQSVLPRAPFSSHAHSTRDSCRDHGSCSQTRADTLSPDYHPAIVSRKHVHSHGRSCATTATSTFDKASRKLRIPVGSSQYCSLGECQNQALRNDVCNQHRSSQVIAVVKSP